MHVPVARAVKISARRVGSEQDGIAASSSEVTLSSDGVALLSDSDMASTGRCNSAEMKATGFCF
jgi:hypothetical protein